MDRSASADPASRYAVTGMTVAFPLRMPMGGVASTLDAEQLQQTARPAAMGHQIEA